MQTHLKRWTDSLLEWLGATSAADDGWDRWVAFALVVLAAVLFDLLLRLGIVRGVRKLVTRTRAKWDDTLFSVPVLNRMCHILSAILLAVVLEMTLGGGATLNPDNNPEYRSCKQLGEEICAALTQVREAVRENMEAASAPKQAVTCPFCGATTTPDASGCCEFCGGAVNR